MSISSEPDPDASLEADTESVALPVRAATVRQQILNWQSKLIELNKRNPLYCLPANDRGILPLNQPGSDEIAKVLSAANRHFLFSPLPDALDLPVRLPPDTVPGQPALAFDQMTDPAIDLPRPAPPRRKLKANHFEISAEEFKKLGALRTRAASALREQGINILFVAIGALEWLDPATRERLRSPLILIPVTLERVPGSDALRLARFPDDMERNPTLAYRLSQNDLAMTLPELPDADDVVPSEYLTSVRDAVAGRTDWVVSDQVVLGRFSFQKMAMYRDLDRQIDAACAHPVIEALAGNPDALERLPSIVLPALEELDEATAGEAGYSVLDSDPTQQRAILAAKRGQSFVLQGPPGTGKSQTIANIIAECIADGKRVLFVSQKMAALEAVYKRLRDKGLHDLCLEAHSHKANKKDILEQLRKSQQARVPALPAETVNEEVFAQVQAQLDTLVAEIGQPREPLGISLYTVNGRIAVAADVPDLAFTFVDPEAVTQAEFHNLTALAERLARHHDLFPEALTHPWRDIKAERFSLDLQSRVRAVFGDFANMLPMLITEAASLADACGAATCDSLAAIDRLLVVANLLAVTPHPPRHWLVGNALDSLVENARFASTRYQNYRQSREALLSSWRSDILELPHAALIQSLSTFNAATLAPALGSDWTTVAAERHTVLSDRLVQAIGQCERLERTVQALAGRSGMSGTLSLGFCRYLLGVAGIAAQDIRPLLLWFEDGAPVRLSRLADDAAGKVTEYNTARAALLAVYDESFLRLDVAELSGHFSHEYAGLGRFINPAFYRERGAVRRCLRPGIDPASRDLTADLASAARVAELRQWIDQNDRDLQREFGAHYRGTDTDWDTLRGRLRSLTALVDSFTGGRVPETLIQRMVDSGMEIAGLRDLHAQVVSQLTALDNTLSQLGENVTLTVLPFSDLPLSQVPLHDLGTWFAEVHVSLEDFHTAGSEVSALSVTEDAGDTASLIAALSEAKRVAGEAEKIDIESEALRYAYGPFYNGVDTDWERTLNALTWTQSLRAQFGPLPNPLVTTPSVPIAGESESSPRIGGAGGRSSLSIGGQGDQGAGVGLPDAMVAVAESGSSAQTAEIAQLAAALSERVTTAHRHLETIGALFPPERLQIASVPLASASIPALASWLQTRLDRIADLERWIDFQNLKRECADCGMLSFFETAVNRQILEPMVVPAFHKRFYRLWHDAVCDSVPALRQFRGDEHSRLIGEFCRMDRSKIENAPQQIRALAQKGAPGMLHDLGEVGALKRMLAQRRTKPILKMLADIPNLLFKLKPCLMMSPLSVSLFLDSAIIRCDVVIFDEASQIFTEDAVCSLLRADQVVIAGDTKQLPPTSFFKNLEDDSEEDEDAVQYESVLQAAATVANASSQQFAEHPLSWHYRSRHDSLIAFSKKNFYEHITAFPSPRLPSAVRFIHVEDGVYYPGATRRNNPVEASRTIDAVIEYARANPQQSLGVITFNESQKTLIEAEADRRGREDAEVAALLKDQGAEGFFVKNIENVQGDERDAIFLSVGFGRTPDGKLSMNFGPISTEGGERRLNVAVTRARQAMTVVSSILPGDLRFTAETRCGPRLLREYLDYAQSSGGALPSMPHVQEDFERAVEEALVRAGLQVRRHVGRFEYAVDLAVLDPDDPDNYLLGIECDSRFYREAHTARERDRLRGSVLKDLGWRLHRVWSSDWVRNPAKEVESILAAVVAAKAPTEVPPAPQISETPAPHEAAAPIVNAAALVREARPAYGAPAVTPAPEPKLPEPPPDVLAQIPGLAYFEPTSLRFAGGRDALYDESKAAHKRRCALLLQLVEQEGPLPLDAAVQRMAVAAEIGRAGSRVREILDDALEELEGQGKIETRDDFLWISGLPSVPARVPRPGDTPRPVEQISLEEIAEVSLVLLRASYGMRRDELVTETSRLLGYRNTGVNIRDRINEALALLELEDRIHLMGNQVRALDPA